MIYFLFLLDLGEAFPYVSILVTNMGTEGRHNIIDANKNISLGMFLPWEINADPIVRIPEMKCWCRCYISYSYRSYEKHFRMYQYWSQIWALWVGIGASLPTQVSRWECVSFKKYNVILLSISLRWHGDTDVIFLIPTGCMRSISVCIEIGHKYGHSG